MKISEQGSGRVDLDHEVRHDTRGNRITETDANDTANAIERNELAIDESRVVYPRRGRGRPSLSEAARPGEPSPKVEARVPPALKSRLARHAGEHGRPAADVVREAIEEYLARH